MKYIFLLFIICTQQSVIIVWKGGADCLEKQR